MKGFADLKTAEELKQYLDTPLTRKQPKEYYHYTKLSKLIEIYKNGTFKASKIKDMNDKLEKDFANNCTEYFTCLMGSAIESFGMWAMYGGIGAHINKKKTNSYESDAYVKIKIPTDSIKTLIKESEGKISIRRIAYTNLNSQLIKDIKPSILYCSSLKNKIDCLNSSKLKGYIKDNAWSYEKEVRLVSKKEFIDISSILNSFRIIPSPNNNIQECKLIFRRLKGKQKLMADPIFEENVYYNLIINK